MKITIELTDEEIEAILITAGEQGCGYWARTHDSLADVLVSVLPLDYAHVRLRKLGVDKALAKAGARQGDLVRIGKLTFEYDEDGI